MGRDIVNQLAEDGTAASVPKLHDEKDEAPVKIEKQQTDSRSVWLCVFFGVFAAVTVGLGIYGLASHAKPMRSKLKGKLLKSVMDLSIKPRDETRTFQFATLANGVQAVTVRDSRALQKAFATAVEAGSFDDPVKLPGLAHFCEHMLFLGTEKYKDPSGFDNFVAAHGGYNNAYTADEVTVYFASVSQDAASEGLDRFADFFKTPLFKDAYVDKEVHAIDSEHAKNIQDPSRQVMGVLYSLAADTSPVSRFHTGDLKTLSVDPKKAQPPINPVEALKEYWQTHYCPNKMKVVSVGSETNADQLKLIQKQFGDLQPRSAACDKPRQKFAAPNPWPAERMQKWVNVQGMLPKSFMWLQFPMPDLTRMYKSEPLDYIEYVLTYAGENSLTKVLTDSLGLAASMNVMFDTSSAGTVMFIVLQLTKNGRENAALVLDVIFAYLAVLKREGVQESLYNSIATVQKLSWDWNGQGRPADTAEDLAEKMTRAKPQDLLWVDSLIERPDPQLVESLLGKMVPTNMNIAFVKEASNKQAGANAFAQGEEVKTLPHYDLQYSVQDINRVLMPGSISKWTKWLDGDTSSESIENSIKDFIKTKQIPAVPGMAIVPQCPGKIDGIPNSLTFEHMHAEFTPYSTAEAVDTLLYGASPSHLDLRMATASPYGKSPEVWYRSGWMTPSPKVQISLALRPLRQPNDPGLNALQELQLDLYGRLLSAEMAPKLVDVTATGMGYDIGVGGGGLDFDFAGFAPSMHTLITKVLSEFNAFNKNSSLTPQVRWDRHLHQLREDLNTYSSLPINYAVGDRNLLLVKGGHSRAEMLEALDKKELTLKSAVTSVSELLLSEQLRLTALAMGNMGEDDARSMIGDFLDNIKSPMEVSHVQHPEATLQRLNPVVHITKPVEVRKLNPRHGDKNDVTIVSIMGGISTIESRVNLGLLSQIFGPVAYNELRTNQQLGYIVSAGAVELSNVQLLSCVVQGDRMDADATEASIHYVFMDLMVERLKELTDKEFNAFKSSFRQELLQPPLTVSKEFGHFTGPVDQGGVGFTLQNEMLRYLAGPLATKDTLRAAWEKLVLPMKGERKVVTVKYFAKDVVPPPPSLEQAREAWIKHKVPLNARVILEREFQVVERLSKVDSEERSKLAKIGGWHSTDQHFELTDDRAASKEALQVPQQIKDLIAKRKQDIDAFVDTPVEYTTTDLSRNSAKLRSNGNKNHVVRVASGASFSLSPGA